MKFETGDVIEKFRECHVTRQAPKFQIGRLDVFMNYEPQYWDLGHRVMRIMGNSIKGRTCACCWRLYIPPTPGRHTTPTERTKERTE